VKILPYALLGFLTLLCSPRAYGWNTLLATICGETCHTMHGVHGLPNITAARIDCVDCHIGKGFIATRITPQGW